MVLSGFFRMYDDETLKGFRHIYYGGVSEIRDDMKRMGLIK